MIHGKNPSKHLNMTNNLFLKAKDWPTVGVMENTKAIIGDPWFINAGGSMIMDYQPTNTALIANKGIEIVPLPKSIGLQGNSHSGGLTVTQDILGNNLNGQVHIGAIVPIIFKVVEK
jgi:hypothetical protein